MKTLFLYLREFAMPYDACNVQIIRRQTSRLTTLDMMNVGILDCYECKNLIQKLQACVIPDHVLSA